MYLFFDTETTGLAKFKLSPKSTAQPRLVQLAALLTNESGDDLASMNLTIKPDGWEIPEEASAIHGITQELAEQIGVNHGSALGIFNQLSGAADTVVAHNLDFDSLIAESAFHRWQGQWRRPEKQFCTMKAATSICKIPHASPRHPEDWKWPRLEECIRFFFDEELEGAHDAMIDVRACKRVFFELKNKPSEEPTNGNQG